MGRSEDRVQGGNSLSIFEDTMVEMTWEEVGEASERGDIVLLPIGVIEEHGPHMDLSPDVYMACIFCQYLKRKLSAKGIHAIIAPPFYWGISEEVKKYPGTFSIRQETMKALLVDIFTSLDSWGFTHIFIVNSHGDPTHNKTIDAAVTQIKDILKINVYNLANLDVTVEKPPVFPPQREGRFEPDYHAGSIETAAVHTFYPQKVKMDLARGLKPQSSFHPLGYCGDPAGFEKENSVLEFFEADSELDSLKIKEVLKK